MYAHLRLYIWTQISGDIASNEWRGFRKANGTERGINFYASLTRHQGQSHRLHHVWAVLSLEMSFIAVDDGIGT